MEYLNIDPKMTKLESARRVKLSEALVQVGHGDRSAFETVYVATSAKLFGVCLQFIPDRQEAEDVLQDVYLTIWNKAASFESDRQVPSAGLLL